MHIRMIRIKLIQTLISIRINSPLSKVYSSCVRCVYGVRAALCCAVLFFASALSLPTNCDWCLHLSCGRACVTTSSLEVELCACLASNCIYVLFASMVSIFLFFPLHFAVAPFFHAPSSSLSAHSCSLTCSVWIFCIRFCGCSFPARFNVIAGSFFMFVIIQFLVI